MLPNMAGNLSQNNAEILYIREILTSHWCKIIQQDIY